MSARRAAFVAAALAVCGAACGGGQTRGRAFNRAHGDDGASMGSLQRQLASVPIPLGEDVAVGAFGHRALVGVPLGGGKPWTFEHPIACRPIIAGSIVVGLGDSEMFGLDAKTGKKLWARKAAGCLRGAADDGKITLVSARPITGSGGIVLAIARDGMVLRQIEDTANIGAPGLIDGFAFFPWDAYYVSAYDLSLGQEVARVKLTEPVSRAFTTGGALFFGELSATRFDERIELAPKDRASSVRLPSRPLPDDPEWMGSGTESPPLGPLAADSVRLYARPESRGAPGISGGRYVATHGRVAVGLAASDGALAWARAHAARLIGGAAYEGGFAL
jgi:outer membrane protein assembly factor BamB